MTPSDPGSPKPKFSLRTGGRVVSGFVLLLVGAILAIPGVPGPGIAVIIVGLVILSEHFHWARRTLDWVKRKADRVVEKSGLKWPRGKQKNPPAGGSSQT